MSPVVMVTLRAAALVATVIALAAPTPARTPAAPVVPDDRALSVGTHWMWFVFPQTKGIGTTEKSRFCAISGLEEAAAHLARPSLGPRLHEITAALLQTAGQTVHEIVGSPDDLRLTSSLTLFAAVAPPGSALAQALGRFFGGERDPATLSHLG